MPTTDSTPEPIAVTQIAGTCDAAFSGVRDAFAANFAEHGEIGAACAVYVEGRKVVDLWGGTRDADRREPWRRETLAGFYSTGKPIAALCALQQVDRGVLDLDAPVARVWPEFAANGKAGITPRQILCHRAGLPALRGRLAEGAMLDWEAMTTALAAEPPWWEPGTRHVYHTNTYGFLVGELVRRLTGLTPGAWLRERIAGPLGADVFFGLAKQDLERAAYIHWEPSPDPPSEEVLAVLFQDELPEGVTEERRMIMLGNVNPSGLSGLGVMNTAAWRCGEVPSTNGFGTARGVARLYDALLCGYGPGGRPLLSPELLREACTVQSEGPCPALDREMTFGLGFALTRPDRPLGPNVESYGHFGTGGSLGFADPTAGVAFAYVMNHIIPRWQSPRNRALIDAVYTAL